MFKDFLNNKNDILTNIKPHRIYVENVRSFFNFPYGFSKFLCEMAVQSGHFRKRFGVQCSNADCTRIISHYSNKEQIPHDINCDICEELERENHSFNKNEIEIIEFYQLNNNGNTN